MSFIPARDAQLVPWSANFSTKITAKPAAYGLTAGQAMTYAALNTAFAAAARTSGPAAWSTPNVVTRTIARRRLVANARLLARVVQAATSVSEGHRAELGLTDSKAKPKRAARAA